MFLFSFECSGELEEEGSQESNVKGAGAKKNGLLLCGVIKTVWDIVV